MALRGTGVTTLTFANDSQAAQYITSTVVTDSAPNPYVMNWTQQTLPASTTWTSVVYGNGLWVAVASGGTIAATSPDGITWTQRTLPVSAAWSRVGYGNGMFVALAGGTTIAASSPDGITWTQRTLPVAALWTDVAYGNGVFAAVAAGPSTIAATSPDGVTWTQQVLPSSRYWYAIAYGNGTFVTVSGGVAGGTSDVAATSPDGVTWTQSTLPASRAWTCIAFGNGLFMILEGGGGGANPTSPDGINWTARTTIASVPWHLIAYSNGVFCAYSANGYINRSVNNGLTWSLIVLVGGVSSLAGGVASGSFGGGVSFVEVITGTNKAFTSVDGFGSIISNTRTITTVNTQTVPAYPVPGSNTATATITGLIDITSGGSASAFLMASNSTASHNAYEHGLVRVVLRCADFVAGVGFTIHASSPDRLDGTFEVRYAWSA